MVALVFTVITFVARALVYPHLSDHSILYLQLGEVAKIGYFAMKMVSELATKLLNEHHPKVKPAQLEASSELVAC